MKIDNHRLVEGRINFTESPNKGGLFNTGFPDTIIIHYTAGSSLESSVKALCDSKTKASAHLVIGRDGSTTQLMPFNIIAWHAGNSTYKGRIGFNKYALGIEIDNAGRLTKSGGRYVAWFGRTYLEEDVIEAVHRNESKPSYWHRYTEEQIAVVYDICVELIDVYRISEILGHEEISQGRKSDPGPAFPLDKLRERLLQRDRAEEGEEKPLPMQKIGIVTAPKLNIRSSPSVEANKVTQPLPQGTIVNIVQETSGWYKVKLQTEGWVKKEYIRSKEV
ncbi:N-acetylmuramoyl-L-alanine amidase [bacterium]|nr:N-acetylmuramoyl-L-alanine amidase [bacterium]